MDFRSFKSSAMMAITAPWTDERLDRPVLMSIPMIAAIMPELTDAHRNLVSIRVTASSFSEELKALINQSLSLDGRYDGLYRGAYYLLTGAADITKDEAKKNLILQHRDTLFPKGLAGVQDAYLDEAGNVEIVENRLTPKMRAFLDTIVIDGVSMTAVMDKLVETGRALGASERRRAQLAATTDDETVKKSDVLRARYRWINIVQVMLQLIDIAPNVSEETRTRILQPLLREEAKRSKRRASGESDESEIDDLLSQDIVDDTAEETAQDTAASS